MLYFRLFKRLAFRSLLFSSLLLVWCYMGRRNAGGHGQKANKLGRGQSPPASYVTATISGSGRNVTVTFSEPVAISGTLDLHISGAGSVTSQTVGGGNAQIQQTYETDVTGLSWRIYQYPAAIQTKTGSGLVPSSGTF